MEVLCSSKDVLSLIPKSGKLYWSKVEMFTAAIEETFHVKIELCKLARKIVIESFAKKLEAFSRSRPVIYASTEANCSL